MKKAPVLIISAILLVLSLSAQAIERDYTGPQDMQSSCGNAVIKQLLYNESEVSRSITDQARIDLDWFNDTKTAVSFTIQAHPDELHEDLISGNISITLNEDKSCTVGKITDISHESE